MPPMRQDQFRLKAAVTGVNPPPIKSWQGWSGGDPEAEDTKTRPGAGEQQISLGGPPTRSDVTITRLDSTTIHPYKLQWENVVGKASMWASYTPIDANGNPSGATVTLHGLLKGVKYTEKDADAQGKATISLVMSCQSEASISE